MYSFLPSAGWRWLFFIRVHPGESSQGEEEGEQRAELPPTQSVLFMFVIPGTFSICLLESLWQQKMCLLTVNISLFFSCESSGKSGAFILGDVAIHRLRTCEFFRKHNTKLCEAAVILTASLQRDFISPLTHKDSFKGLFNFTSHDLYEPV